MINVMNPIKPVCSLLYNVCYHSMAKAERSQESGGPGTALTKTPSVNEISSDTEIVSSEGTK